MRLVRVLRPHLLFTALHAIGSRLREKGGLGRVQGGTRQSRIHRGGGWTLSCDGDVLGVRKTAFDCSIEHAFAVGIVQGAHTAVSDTRKRASATLSTAIVGAEDEEAVRSKDVIVARA